MRSRLASTGAGVLLSVEEARLNAAGVVLIAEDDLKHRQCEDGKLDRVQDLHQVSTTLR